MKWNCFVIGVNHNTADTSTRSRLSVNEEVRDLIFAQAKIHPSIKSLLILNTCNRTEIAGLGDADEALRLYKSFKAIPNELEAALFVKNGHEAIDHLFEVASGVNSKIMGDLEILGQFKRAFKESKSNELLHGYFERLGNYVIQAAKEVKSNTEFSTGTTSLSYAMIQYLKLNKINPTSKILILGSGKFGSTTAKNIRNYFPNINLFLANRTDEKAKVLAEKLKCASIKYTDWKTELSSFDVIVSAADKGNDYLIHASDLAPSSDQCLIDMSVPLAIDPACKLRSGITLINIDELSEIINTTLQKRSQEVQRVKHILQHHKGEFLRWSHIYAKSDTIKTWKASLKSNMEACPYLSQLSPELKEQYLKTSVKYFVQQIKSTTSLPHHDNVITEPPSEAVDRSLN